MVDKITPIDIELIRGQAGLGFNIKGGVDIPHIEGDPGIFVAKIREKGAAADDGNLKEGDKIIEINGHIVEKVQHQDAVAHFLNAGSHVKLKVLPGAEAAIKKMRQNIMSGNGGLVVNNSQQYSYTSLALISVGVLVTLYAGYRYIKQKS